MTVGLCGMLALGLLSLYARSFERFAGLRYLNRGLGGRPKRRLNAFTLVSAAVAVGGAALFLATRGKVRALETVGVLAILAGTLSSVVCLLLRLFSVFTTVSTMGVALGVQSLIVVLGVTSGFQREFQDKVLALNAHLIVIPYGDVDVDTPRRTRSRPSWRTCRAWCGGRSSCSRRAR